MPNQSGRLAALERGSRLPSRAGMPNAILDLDEALAAAEKISRSGLVPKAFTNPAAVLRVGMKGQAMGIGFFEAIDVIDPIDGRPVPNAQCRLGHIRHMGHEAEFVFDECNRDQAVIRGRRREHRHDAHGWRTVTYTIQDAEEAGLLDEWVEHKVRLPGDQYDRTEKMVLRRTDTSYVPAALGADLPEWAAKQIKVGQIKRRDNWWKQRPSMLRARAASTLYRMHFSDLIFSATIDAYTAEEMGVDIGSDVDDPDDDIVDCEIIEIAVAPPGPAQSPEGSQGEPSGEPQTTATAGGRDNVDDASRGSSTVPDPLDWQARAKELSISQGTLLLRARDFAVARDLPPPPSIQEITDEHVIADIQAWLT